MKGAGNARTAAGSERTAPFGVRDAALGVGVAVMATFGYGAVAEPRLGVACAAAAALAAWALIALRHAPIALSLSFSMLLVAGTKFRTRDADASLAGQLDAQVVMELALFAAIGLAAVAVWAAAGRRRRMTAVERVITAYAALAMLSTAWSAAPALTVVRSMQLAAVALLSIAAVRLLGPAPVLWTAVRALAVHVLFFSAVAAASPWMWDSFYSEEGFRFRWFAVHPIDVATLAGLGALGLLGTMMFPRPRGIAAAPGLRIGMTVAALLAVLVLTSSRGPLLALAASLGVLWLLKVRPAARVPAMIVGVAAALLLIAYATHLRGTVEWLASQDTAVTQTFFRGQTADTVFELNGRLDLWRELMPLVVDRAAFGYGYQASRGVLLDVAEWAAYAHNAFLQTALDLGIPGLVAILCLLVPAVRGAVLRADSPGVRATIAALLVFLLVNALSTESFAAVPHFETLLLFLLALCAEANCPRPAAAPGVARARTQTATHVSATHPSATRAGAATVATERP